MEEITNNFKFTDFNSLSGSTIKGLVSGASVVIDDVSQFLHQGSEINELFFEPDNNNIIGVHFFII